METNKEDEQFDPATAWMSNPEEKAIRILADEESFAKLYPDLHRGYEETKVKMAIDDPMFFIDVINKYLQFLPEAIELAKKGPDSARIRQLANLQRIVEDTLSPKIPVHEVVYDYINKREDELKYYLNEVLTLKQQITDPQTTKDVPPPNSDEGEKSKKERGTYKNSTKEDALRYFDRSVRDAVEVEIRNRRVVNKGKIIDAAYCKLVKMKSTSGQAKYNERTLRAWLPAPIKEELFGEIHRQVLYYFSLTNK